MNSQNQFPTSLLSLAYSFYKNSKLINEMGRREVSARYKGTLLGIIWSFLNPALMLTIYTFVFSTVLQARWGEVGHPSKTQFATILFVGLIIQWLFAEVIQRAPTLIITNSPYVKKIVFPLEILPIVTLGSALFQGLVSLLVLLIALVAINGYLHWTVIFFPLILLPFLFFTLGLAWIFASLGVFLRDVEQTIGIFTTVLLFLSPTFYPLTAVPEGFRPFIMANPLTFIIDQAREVLIWGNMPDWLGLAIYTILALGITEIGYKWFQKSRKGFADVL